MIVSVVVEERRRKLQDAPKTFQELLTYTTQAFQPFLDSFADKIVNFQWVDEDGDKITISSDSELLEALNLFKGKDELPLFLDLPSDADRAVLSIALASCPISDEPVGASSEVETEGWVIVDAAAAKAEGAEQSDSAPPEDPAPAPPAAAAAPPPAACAAKEQPKPAPPAASAPPAPTSAPPAPARAPPAPAPAPAPPARAPPAPAPAHSPSWETQNASPELWTLMLQLTDMGFGEDYDSLREALERNNMDLSATAEELLTSRAV